MCDTLCVRRPDRVLFGKNSDRDANEPQVLQWVPARDWPEGSAVECTEVSVPQVAHTHAVLLSRPAWMWGAEMGANEHGVVIGNEAVFTRHPVDRRGLLGMDLLRLALERAASADEAVQVLVTLLERHGQGGRAGLEDPSFRYHNSFLVADAATAWVVETAGRRHAEERVDTLRTISNTLTIEGFRQAHRGLVGRVKSGVAAADARRSRTAELARGAAAPADLFAVLRDHGPAGDGPVWRWANGGLHAPCMHGGGVLAHSVTTASWVTEWGPDGIQHWATASSAPCIALFKPVAVDAPVDLGPVPTSAASPHPWWEHERLHRAWMREPERLGALFLPERDAVEQEWLADPPPSPAAFDRWTADLLPRWVQAVTEAAGHTDERPFVARRYWTQRDRRAGLA